MRRLLPALALLLAGCAGAAVPEKRAEGNGPTIVSLNPCTDAILAEVTAPGQLLAVSHYSKDPAASSLPAALAARLPATGGTAEEVLALRPDIVVASSFIAPTTQAALEELGMRVETFGIAHTVAESEAQVRRLAALARQPARGEALVARIEAALNSAAAAGTGPPMEAALWQGGGIVPGEGELVSDLMRRTGFASYAAARGMAQADYLPLEQILADPPGLLLIAGSERGQRHPVLDKVPGMIVRAFDPALTYCGGPTIIRAAGRLAQLRRGGA